MNPMMRTKKTLSIFIPVAAILLMSLLTQLPGFNTSSAGQDDKAAATPPKEEEVSGDKEDEPVGGVHRFMRQKMQASNRILEGLCTDDLKLVTEGTETLLKMPKEAKWRISNDIMYRRYSTEFVQAVEELQEEAENHDIDGASMAWVNVTMKCLKCHKWVRNPLFAESAE